MTHTTSKDSIDYKRRVLKARAEILAKSLEDLNFKIDPIEIILFKLDRENFALETKYVNEVYSLKEFTPLPGAPPFFYGLANVRRRIVPIIDLKVFFSIPNDVNIEKKILIIENEDVEFAILIDGFSGIKTISKNELQATLPTLTGIRKDFLRGLIVDGTVILDGEKLLTSPHLVIETNKE